MKGGICSRVILYADALVRELQDVLRKQKKNDFENEYITVELDEEQFIIDTICHRKMHSDPECTHLCLKLRRPDSYGCGIIR